MIQQLKIADHVLPSKNTNPAAHAVRVHLKTRRNPLPEIGLAFPFQPSLRISDSGLRVMNEALNSLRMHAANARDERFLRDVLLRAERLFTHLNYQTDRKSVAMVFTAEKDEIFYLDYVVTPLTISGKSISILDLAAELKIKPEFYMLALCHKEITIHEFNNNKLNLNYRHTEKNVSGQSLEHAKNTLKHLNKGFNKPVFISGETSMVQAFVDHADFYQIIFKAASRHDPCSPIYLKEVALSICDEWPYWQNKFLQGKILMELQNGILTRADAVLRALSEKANGLLLIHDTFLKKVKDLKTAGNSVGKEWLYQVESFVTRGNRIIVTRQQDFKSTFNVLLIPRRNNTNQVSKLKTFSTRPVHFNIL